MEDAVSAKTLLRLERAAMRWVGYRKPQLYCKCEECQLIRACARHAAVSRKKRI